MGTPLKIGGKDERYSRVEDRAKFGAHFDEIDFGHAEETPHPRGGRTTIKYRNGERLVVREHGKVLLPEEVDSTKFISMYDLLEQAGRIEQA